MINIDRVRTDTPATKTMVHFNNAGASLMPTPVYQTMLDYLHSEQSIGGYETAEKFSGLTRAFYTQAARLIGATEDEIAFFDGATRAWQTFFYSLKLRQGDRIITSYLDYGSNFVGYIHLAQRIGIEIKVIGGDESGGIDMAALESAIDHRTALISISHIPTANGIINPAAEIGRLAQQAGVPFLLDACQSLGQIDVNVNEIGCTALSAAGRKYLRGPRGSGMLYVDKAFAENLDPIMLDQHGVELTGSDAYRLHEGARRFENFETGFAARVGLGSALEYANILDPSNIEQCIVSLGGYCRRSLLEAGATVHDLGVRQGGIVMFSLPGKSPTEIHNHLGNHGFNTGVSAGSGSLVEFQQRGIDSLVRASLHYFNTEQEIDRMVALVAELASGRSHAVD